MGAANRVTIAQSKNDAHRLVQAATVIAALSGMMDERAREKASIELRMMARRNPGSAEVLLAIAHHLEGT